jgi:RNA polymerase sigma-70 factor (ECF subfamily)
MACTPQGPASEDPLQLAVRLQQGDVAALETILQTLGPKVAAGLQKRHAALGAEDIEDVLSMSSHRLWQSRAQYDPKKGSLAAWFFIIADNLARDLLRKESQRRRLLHCVEYLADKEIEDRSREPDAPDPHKQKLDEILNALGPLDRCIIAGFARAGGEGPWAANLAEELGLRAGTIRVRCRRIKAKIRQELLASGAWTEVQAL